MCMLHTHTHSYIFYIQLHQILRDGVSAFGLWPTSSVTVSTRVLGLWWSETSLTAAVSSRWYWSYFSCLHSAHSAHSTILEVSEMISEICTINQHQTETHRKLSDAVSISPFLLLVPLSEKCNTGDVGIPHSARSQSKHPVQGGSVCGPQENQTRRMFQHLDVNVLVDL